MADLAIVHGLRTITGKHPYKNIISIPTIIRKEIVLHRGQRGKNIYCVLGGGTVNSNQDFIDSSVKIAEVCIRTAYNLRDRETHIVCSCDNITSKLRNSALPSNVIIHDNLLSPSQIYSDAAVIITRSGRNTLSEVAYLGIPTVTFVTGDRYRIEEQRQNIKSLNCSNVVEADLTLKPSELLINIQDSIASAHSSYNDFSYGNDVAICSIKSLMTIK